MSNDQLLHRLHDRLTAQLLHRPAGLGAGDLVRHLVAVQAQDVPAALLAFRARSATVTVAEVEAAWHGRELVRTWGPRGTLHFVHVEDLPWLLALTGGLGLANTRRRLAEEGVEADDPLALIDRTLAGQGPLTKAELTTRLAGRARGQGVVHLVGLAAAHGLAVLGPLRDGKPTYVHTADWLGAPITPAPDRARALAELGVRYRRAHADATPADLAAWSGLPLGAARRAWPPAEEPAPPAPDPKSSAQPMPDLAGAVRLAPAPAGSAQPVLDLAGVVRRAPDLEGFVRLAPAFDEYLLGWADRTPILAERHRREVFPGGGILRPIVLVDGVIRGTWSRRGSEVTLTPFGEFPQAALPALAAEIDDVRRFLTPNQRPDQVPGPGSIH